MMFQVFRATRNEDNYALLNERSQRSLQVNFCANLIPMVEIFTLFSGRCKMHQNGCKTSISGRIGRLRLPAERG